MCILGSVNGDGWKPEPLPFRMFKIIPHTHEIITVSTTK